MLNTIFLCYLTTILPGSLLGVLKLLSTNLKTWFPFSNLNGYPISELLKKVLLMI